METKELLPVKQLNGVVHINGAKNSVLLLLAAVALAEDQVVLSNVPEISDVGYMCLLLNQLNIKTTYVSSDTLLIDPSEAKYADLTGFECQEVRTSILFLGAMLGRFGRAKIRSPGGCDLGKRPIDYHIQAMKMMGANIEHREELIIADSINRGDCVVDFHSPTVTGTANAILAAVGREGETHIHGAVLEPEIDDLISFFVKLGVEIRRLGILIIVHGGVKKRAIEHRVMADRIEAGTFLIAAAVLGGRVTVQGIAPYLLAEVTRCLDLVGAQIITSEDSITIEMHTRPKALDIVTGPFPAFPTDLQPQWSVLAAISDGVSSIQDNIYQQRVDHFEELNKLGAKCRLFSNGAVVSGVEKLHGGVVIARSLRSAASMVIAALKSEKKTKIMNINYIYRGYCGIFDKFKSLTNNEF